MSQDYTFLGGLVAFIVLAWIAIEVLSRAAQWTRQAIDDRVLRREAYEDDRAEGPTPASSI